MVLLAFGQIVLATSTYPAALELHATIAHLYFTSYHQ